MLLRLLVVVLAQIHRIFACDPWCLLQTLPHLFYPLLCASYAIKTHDYGQSFDFYHKATDKTLGQCFLKELKVIFKKAANQSYCYYLIFHPQFKVYVSMIY